MSLIEQIQARIHDLSRATDGADLVRPTISPAVSEAAIQRSEQTLGFDLPPLLRQLYRAVGDGGFGPGYGLLGLAGGAADAGRNSVDLYTWFRQPDPDDPAWRWPELLLPICDLGCGMYACVDCASPAGPVVWFEPNPREPGDPLHVFLIPAAESLEGWLGMWLRDEDWMGAAYVRSALYAHTALERWRAESK